MASVWIEDMKFEKLKLSKYEILVFIKGWSINFYKALRIINIIDIAA